jgi:hypothetical protein
MIRTIFAFAAVLLLAAPNPAAAQSSIGYAEAIDRLATSCGKDIDKFCKTVHLGGGRILQCLDRNAAGVSAQCKATRAEVQALLARRAEARRSVRKLCDVDIRRFCAGIQPGDGNLMECFYKAKARISPACQRAVADAGYE